MVSRVVSRLLVLVLLLGVLFCARVAWASALALQTLAAEALVPSAVPALLGPITATGRIGWNCAPEHAAGAPTARGGELPGTEPKP